jgi:hypothetical protein
MFRNAPSTDAYTSHGPSSAPSATGPATRVVGGCRSISAPAPHVQEGNNGAAELKIRLSVGAAPVDFITVATAADRKLMTKIFFVGRDKREQTRNFDKGYLFNFSTRPVACLDDLARVLDGLKQHSCVIYGRLIEGTSMPCRRLLNRDAKTGDAATVEDAAHSWVLLDIDKLAIEDDVFDPVTEPERAVEYIRAKLPPEFHRARCLWRLTSSAGVGKRDTISMRLGFWLDRALTGAEAKAWLTGTIADSSIYTPNQVIYAAAPIFIHGRVDPVPKRSGILEGRATVAPGDTAAPIVRVPRRVQSQPKLVHRHAPEGVVFDTEAAVAAGRDSIKRALASDEWQDPRPTPTGARAYKLAARLKDQALSPEMIVDLLVELVPWFDEEDRPALAAMVESVFLHGQNDPGCGPTNGLTRLFGAIVAEWEAEAEQCNELWDQVIRSSQGALQRLPEAPPPAEFSPAFTEEVRRIISEDRAELARRLK